MKVSVITPCYNAASYIQRTIASVQAQTISDWEMIIVDDGSKDNSVSTIQEIAKTDSRIHLIEKENGGSASARNMGLQYAVGEYIQLLDADDMLASDKFEKQIALMEAHHLDVSYTDYRKFNPDGKIEELQGLNESLLHLLVGWGVLGTIPPHCYLYRKEFIQTHNILFASIREREDWDWHIKVFNAHPKAERLKGYCGAFYFKSPTGKTSDGDLVKVHQGSCRFLCYIIQQSKGISCLLLSVRLSLEIWSMLMQMLRYKLWDMFQNHTFHNFHKKIILLWSIILFPISIPIYIGIFIYNHITNHSIYSTK